MVKMMTFEEFKNKLEKCKNQQQIFKVFDEFYETVGKFNKEIKQIMKYLDENSKQE